MKKNLSIFFLLLCFCVPAVAQTTEFTYQGRLVDGSLAASGTYEMRFRLFDAETDGTQQPQPTPITLDFTVANGNPVAVANGIFTVKLNFTEAAFPGAARFLEISVRRTATDIFTTLNPRQPITSAPHNIRSLSSQSSDGLSSACVLCVTDAHIQSLDGAKLTGVISGNGSGLTNLNGANIASGSVTTTQISQSALPNSSNLKLLGSLRWDLLKEQRSFPVGGGPNAVGFDGSNVWVVNLNDDSVTKLRAADGTVLGTFAVGNNPSGIAFDGANMWITNISDANVTRLRAIDGVNIGSFPTGPDPGAIAFDGANMWITRGGNSVVKLRANDGVVLGVFTVGLNPTGVAFDGANVWIANISSNNVTKLSARDGANLGTFLVNSGPIAVAFDGNHVWVTSIAGNVVKLRASDGANLGSFPAGPNQSGIAFDGANVWITSQSGGAVSKLRTSDGAILGGFSVDGNPKGIAFDGANMWVANNSSNGATRLPPAFPQ